MCTRASVVATVAIVALVLAGCVTSQPVLDTPRGFAAYDTQSTWKAVSPEGVVVRVRLVENEPPQSLQFWAEALKVQLEKSGYTLTGEESLETKSGDAVLLEWAAPVGEDDWIYLTALTVVVEGIAICEAAGEFELYRSHRQAILDSLSTLVIR